MSNALEKLHQIIIEVKEESLKQDYIFLSLCYPELVNEVNEIIKILTTSIDFSKPVDSNTKTTGEFSTSDLSELELLSSISSRDLIRRSALASEEELKNEFYELFTRIKKNSLYLASISNPTLKKINLNQKNATKH